MIDDVYVVFCYFEDVVGVFCLDYDDLCFWVDFLLFEYCDCFVVVMMCLCVCDVVL